MTDRPPGPLGEASPRLLRSAGWTLVGLVVTGAIRFAVRVTADAAFGVVGLGMVTAAMAIATIATIPGAAGMSAGITKLVSELRGRGEAARARRFARRSALAAGTLSLLGALVGAWYAGRDPALAGAGAPARMGVGVLAFAFGLYLTGKAVAFGLGRIKTYSAAELAGAAAFTVVVVVAVVTDSPIGMFYALAAAYLPVALLTALARGRDASSDGPLPYRRLAGYGLVGTVGSLAGIGFTSTTPLAAGVVAGVAGTALVGAALTLLEPLNLAPRAIGLALLPQMSEANAADARDAARESLLTGTRMVAGAAAPACALLFLERDRVLGWVFSEGMVGGATLGWFTVAFFVSVVGAPAVTSLAALGVREAAISMGASIVGFATAGVLWLALGRSMGTAAIALGYAAGSFVQILVPLWVATVRYRVAWRSLWMRVGGLGVAVGLLGSVSRGLATDLAGLGLTAAVLAPELRRLVRALRRR